MKKRDNINLALPIVSVIIGMLLFAYAFVPLYSVFCKLTGYGGTTQEGIKNPGVAGTKMLKVHFDANIADGLPWSFKPLQKDINIKTGETVVVFYVAKNNSTDDIVGTAVYNVTPNKAALYFVKIQCFCFENQLLKPCEEMLMPVSFFIDTELDKDPDLQELEHVTLSYSFYRVKEKL